ncbi:hypothetical protein FGO68_gene15784 [Halteria grandinella]|uniref:Alanine dehydrogenase/pyridine nucleotide transhydrogenase N-terminal domain-containing protein n=1 Tax=Halteria grandinella TaxID=5974 RepID=A0A8J8T164_HALGN|nr:hypothetical protein FGO68_gene15784 [Halteria grandinella]
MELKQLARIGIVRETSSAWERRVPFSPQAVEQLIREQGISVTIQPQSSRCYADLEYAKAGATVDDDLSQCDVISAIKHVKPQDLLSNKTYMMYSRLASGTESIKEYKREILKKNITIIDYEQIKDSEGKSLVGSSKLAGSIGLFNAFRILGMHWLLREGLNTPLIGPNAYQNRAYSQCQEQLRDSFNDHYSCHGGFKKPFIIGIIGRGIVSEGALDLLVQSKVDIQIIKPEDIAHVSKNGELSKVYVSVLSRTDYLSNGISSLADKFLPHLTILVNAAQWTHGTPKILTKEQLSQSFITHKDDYRLKVISDITCMSDGPIEILQELCKIESPYFLYDPISDIRYRGFKEAQEGGSSSHTISYLAVEQLPAELPKDASGMFSDKLSEWAASIVAFTRSMYHENKDFEEASRCLPDELKRAVITTSKGEMTEPFKYLQSLI